MLTDDQRKTLAEPIDRDRVKGRQGPGGRTLSYLSQSDIKRSANRIFGFGGWSYETLSLELIGEEACTRKVKRGNEDVVEKGVRVAYRAHVKVTIPGATYDDWGYGEDQAYNDTALQQHELAIKEAVSDALKRSLVALGDQFGLSLYDEAAALRQGAGTRRSQAQSGDQTSAPPTLTDADLRQIHAERNKFQISEDDLKRLARFVASMPTLESMKDFPRGHRRALLDALGYYASNPSDADEQMRKFEESDAVAAGIPDGYQ